jgi:Ca-activated chloride channel family protein
MNICKILCAALLIAAPASAQQLIAWPVGAGGAMHILMPGQPIRPLPRPLPPRPGPMPRPIPPRPIPAPTPTTPPVSRTLTMSGYAVSGKVTGNVVELTYDIAFHNPTRRRLEGVLMMPIPAKTVLSGFTMTVGGKKMNGEMLEATQARTIYQNIVRSMRDPGLLELAGERMVRARVFPIEPNSEIIVRMKVNQVLSASGGLYGLTIPMRSAKMTGSNKRGGASVKLSLAAKTPIRTLYSPSAGTTITRNGDNAAEVKYTAATGAESDFSLFYSLTRDPLAAGIAGYREDGEDGFFMLTLAPKRDDKTVKAIPKDIVFLVDRSGSMEEGGKMAQAKEALKFCVSKLKPGDRFGIVDFATDANSFQSLLVRATATNKKRALRYIDRIEAAGGTNIEAALKDGMSLVRNSKGRVPMVFFLTDGLPTVGQTNMQALLTAASDKNKAVQARVFSFGVGDDVNTLFLDKLAEMNRGDRDYVRPGESIETKVGALYQKVSRPALTDVRIRFEGIDAHQVYPKKVNDIFYGTELTLMGRYKPSSKGKLIVTGKAGGKAMRFEYPVALPKTSEENSFLPRLWANRRVSSELDALRTAGGSADPEVVNSIVKLAKRYGIVTPYTSYLITEDGFDMTRARREAGRQIAALRKDARTSGFGGGGGVARRAQNASRFFGAIRGASTASAPMVADSALPGLAMGDKAMAYKSSSSMMLEAEERVFDDLKKEGKNVVGMRHVSGKTFYHRGGAWIDGAYEAGAAKKTVRIKHGDQQYMDLLAKSPRLARWLALGKRITVVYRGTAYIID